MKQPPYLKAWFAFFLLATLGGFIVGTLIGVIFGVALSAADMGREVIGRMSTITGFVVGMPVSYLCFRWSVQRFIEPALRELANQEVTLDAPSVPPVGPYEPPRQG